MVLNYSTYSYNQVTGVNFNSNTSSLSAANTISYTLHEAPIFEGEALPDHTHNVVINGYTGIDLDPGYDVEMVDLGLSVKWAACNIGATC